LSANILLGTNSVSALAESVATSGLVRGEDLSAAVTAANGDMQSFARQLLEQQLLTRFQIVTLSQGKGSTLRIGNYDILDRLGAGGMGTVYKARHRRMKRIVALKVLAAAFSQNQLYVKRFQREVETIASLGHPNIVMAYDADEADAGHFLVMEFVDGRDLALCVEQEGTFSLPGAIDCILQAARGLAYAHAQDIIHRDIKPHNLLLDKHGVVKITDLGLARLSRDAEARALTEVTMAGGVIGTVDYMSPEQAVDSTTLDHRSDIYSLGCTLYYLIAGEPPYSGSTVMAILLKHRDAPIPSLSALRPETPAALDQLVCGMLAKQPEQRPQQMSEVVAELEAIAAQLDPGAGDESGSATVALTSASGFSTATLDSRPTMDVTLVATPVTVLVVEPSRVQAAIIKGFLQDHALEVLGTAANGKDAIAAVHSLRPRAVISAMQLPDIEGVALAEQIRSAMKVDAPGFVLITSETEDAASSELKKLNRVQSLVKPFTAEQLIEALNLVTGVSTDLSPPKRKTDRSQLLVLIVDDSSTARMRVRSVLQELGFQRFLEDPDGAHAIVTAARESCDLIVTDYNMPLMDGRALVSYLKQNPATSAIPIVMVTTETEPRVLDPVRKLGVVAVIEKAFPAAVVGPLLNSLF
jgi:serine/threonine protein kinase/CheY-like chemotaxis protein